MLRVQVHALPHQCEATMNTCPLYWNKKGKTHHCIDENGHRAAHIDADGVVMEIIPKEIITMAALFAIFVAYTGVTSLLDLLNYAEYVANYAGDGDPRSSTALGATVAFLFSLAGLAAGFAIRWFRLGRLHHARTDQPAVAAPDFPLCPGAWKAKHSSKRHECILKQGHESTRCVSRLGRTALLTAARPAKGIEVYERPATS